MRLWKYGFIFLAIIVLGGMSLANTPFARAGEQLQIPTVAIATVTGTPQGPMASVNSDQEQINVRGGPSTDYDVIGVLISGQQVPALGRSVGGLWVQIAYPGVEGGVAWVYSPLVNVAGTLPIIEPPPTPTPRTTPTVDPTLAAQFIVEVQPTRLPTFTPPPPLVIPTFTDETSPRGNVGIPMGLVITGLGVIGLFGTFISILRGR